ncbi:MAG: RNA polymerase sigma factor [Acidobacteria bacterium]|nr:MAG: RNA polymerase sigma factor [Acidobacteriota bacterium]
MNRVKNADLPDEVLVMAAILGDIRAFDTLVLRYRPAVVRVAQSIVGEELAEDVAQEALLTAFKALPTLEEPEKFPIWLHMITRHKALRFSRRERRWQEKRLPLDQWLLNQSAALSRPMLNGTLARRAELRWAIDQLPPEYAMIIKLRYYDEMPLKRIAEFMALPLTTIKWRLHRGKQLLKDIINRQGGVYGKGEDRGDSKAG